MDKNINEIKNNIITEIRQLVSKYVNTKTETAFVPGETPIPVSGKIISDREINLMVEAALDGWLTTGRFNKYFEDKLAEFLGVKHVLTVNSGSSANLVAFSTLTSHKLGDKAIRKGDEVITVAAGFPTTVNPIVQFGAIPVFIDVELETHNINADLVEKAITSKTKAIMLAHSLGNPFNLNKIIEVCKKYDLWLIEDCCDALGSTYNGKLVGTFGDISTLSFYPAHHITMGEGGAVYTNNIKLKKIAESFRDWGRDCYCPPGVDNTCNNRFCWTKKNLGGDLPDGYDHKYTYSHLGYNLKITDMQAACGVAQLERLNEFIYKRKKNFKYAKKKFEKLQKYITLPNATENSDPSWFGFPIIVNKSNEFNRNDLIKHLDTKKIGTRLLFAGNLTKQPYMENVEYKISGVLENTDIVMNQTFWIGTYPFLEEFHYDFIERQMSDYFNNKTI